LEPHDAPKITSETPCSSCKVSKTKFCPDEQKLNT
jgi:hypothetical protein